MGRLEEHDRTKVRNREERHPTAPSDCKECKEQMSGGPIEHLRSSFHLEQQFNRNSIANGCSAFWCFLVTTKHVSCLVFD